MTGSNQDFIESQVVGNIKRRAFEIVRGSVVDMSVNATLVIQIFTAFTCQQIHKGKRTMRFIAGLIEAVKVFLFKQQLQFFLHFRKAVDTSLPMPQKLFRSDEVMKPDRFQN